MAATTNLQPAMQRRRFSPFSAYLKDLSIGSKLTVGFGSLVALMIVTVLISYLSSTKAQANFESTKDVRLPMALDTTIVELEMHEMIGNIQSYLSLGDVQSRQQFERDVEEVEELLASLDELSAVSADREGQRRLQELNAKLQVWLPLAEQMFELRDDPVANQPAVKILLLEARPAEIDVLANMTLLVEEQAKREPSADNMRLLKTMADLHSSFNLMTTALDGYLATKDPASKALFYNALADNEAAWEKILSNDQLLTPGQQDTIVWLTQARKVFLSLPDKMFEVVEGEHAREDLYILRTQALPLALEISTLLRDIRKEQQSLLDNDVTAFNRLLSAVQVQTLVGAAVSLLLAVGLAAAIRRDIAGPITRLTHVTTLIRYGDLDARAKVESGDEIGRLAESLNEMTDRLQRSLADAEQRARVIATSSQVSQRLSTILDEEQLVKEVVNQVRSAFDYYYAHIFLLDEDGARLVTAGGIGKIGEELVSRGFEIPLDTGLVGRSARANSPVLVSDVSRHEDYFRNPLLPDIQSEIAVPIAIGDQVLGVLDVQQDVVGGLTQVDVAMLQSIANQVAIALRNARSYAESQQRASRESLINDISRKIMSTTSVERAMQVAVRELGRAVDAPHTSIRLETDGHNGNRRP